jgi:hypothetical protein
MGTFQQYLFMGYSRRLGVSLLGLLGYGTVPQLFAKYSYPHG